MQLKTIEIPKLLLTKFTQSKILSYQSMIHKIWFKLLVHTNSIFLYAVFFHNRHYVKVFRIRSHSMNMKIK